MGNCSYNCWRFSLHSVCPNLWQKAQTFNRVLPLHLWLMKTKKTHMTHACCWFSRHLPNCGPLTSLNTETTLWKIYSVGISQVGIAVMDGKLYGLDLTAAKQVFKVRDKNEEKHVPQWCKLTINRLQLSISSQANHSFKRSDLYISRFPQKLLMASNSNPMTSRLFNTKSTSGKE